MTWAQWRAEWGGANGATAPGIQGRRYPKSEITKIKMLQLNYFSYCRATNTCCMDLIFKTCFFVNACFYILKCQ